MLSRATRVGKSADPHRRWGARKESENGRTATGRDRLWPKTDGGGRKTKKGGRRLPERGSRGGPHLAPGCRLGQRPQEVLPGGAAAQGVCPDRPREPLAGDRRLPLPPRLSAGRQAATTRTGAEKIAQSEGLPAFFLS
ncbi:MAG: hypothetical protein IPK68_11025 [Bdellovibrionales bacterium]|nr:hypothetical protein [Bdellovibrionales bacterium]